MSREDRRDELLHLLRCRREQVGSQAEFSAASLAGEARISVVWFYVLVGREYKTLRASLPGVITDDEDSVGKLREENRGLRAQIQELKSKYVTKLREMLTGVIHHIELLDKENRMLREKVADLEKRLSESEIIIEI